MEQTIAFLKGFGFSYKGHLKQEALLEMPGKRNLFGSKRGLDRDNLWIISFNEDPNEVWAFLFKEQELFVKPHKHIDDMETLRIVKEYIDISLVDDVIDRWLCQTSHSEDAFIIQLCGYTVAEAAKRYYVPCHYLEYFTLSDEFFPIALRRNMELSFIVYGNPTESHVEKILRDSSQREIGLWWIDSDAEIFADWFR
jgi:hypothetical protein